MSTAYRSLRLALHLCGAGLALLAACSRTNVAPTRETFSRPIERPPLAVESGKTPQPSSGVAVVELFTSEGCSSCPAADAALARVAASAERSGLPVYTVELHVDYWDYLGWRDPFDDARFSERQAGYRSLTGSTYTPQAVVNGVNEAIGSDEPNLNQLISLALAMPATTRLALSAERKDGGLLVRCVGDGGELPQTLNLFAVEDNVESNVARGENAGERLRHRNVARAFETRAVPAGHFQATWLARLPAALSVANVRVLAFTERARQAGITGASLAVPR